MATLASRRAAMACRRLSRRLLSHASSARAPLLGHFHQPTPVTAQVSLDPPGLRLPAFQPLTASSPHLSLDFVPVPDLSDFNLYDSHLGLLLFRRRDSLSTSPRLFLVCDPVSRRHVLLHPPPIDRFSGGKVFGAALLSRDADDPAGLRFELVCVALDADRPRAWVASFRDGACTWRAQPRPRDVVIDFDPYWLEYVCVRAAGSLYWHICNNPCALALDAATLAFSFLRAPAMMWDPVAGWAHKYRVGEMPEDGQLCLASLERTGLLLCVRARGARGSDHGWVVARHVGMKKVLDAVPLLPKDLLHRHFEVFLSDVDAGRTGRVFIRTSTCGRFSYHLDTGKLESLATEDGLQYGHPIFPYFSAPADGGSG